MGDRAKLVEERIREEVHPARLDWISAPRGPAIRTLVETDAVQRLLFDEQDLAEIRSDLYPGERLMVCRTPLMAQRRAHRREALLESIAAGAALDGLSIIPTSLPSAASCKACADVARAPGVFAAPCRASCTRPDAHSGDGLHSLACSRPARRQQKHSYPDARQAR